MSKWGIEESETLDAIKKIGFSGNVLNIAAGDGRFNNKLLELSDTVTAIDIDDTDLKILMSNCPDNLKNKLYINKVDITKRFPFEDATFDGVFCTGTLHLFDKETITNILKEIKRVLKLNGRMILDFATDIKRLDKDGNKVTFDGERNYSIDEAIALFNEQLKGFDLTIESANFTEENLEDNTGYNFITGKFLVVSGISKERENNDKINKYAPNFNEER